MGCDQQKKLCPSRSICRRVMAFRILSNNDRSPYWILQILIFWSVIAVLTCCCIPNSIKFGLSVRPPDAHNCWMSRAPLLGNDRCHGNPILGGHVGNMMGCDQPSFVPIGPLLGELWYFQYFPTWRPSALLNFKNFNIWSRNCHWGPNVLLCTEFHRNWFTRSASSRP